MKPVLYGYCYSVYTRVVRFALAEKEVPYSYVEINPFDPELDKSCLAIHPFHRVPVLTDGEFSVYETPAILRYIDETFDGISLQPESNTGRARMVQIISIVDAYGYWPMVRQVFSNRVFAEKTGEYVDERAIQEGLAKSAIVLDALDALSRNQLYLCGPAISLADLHLAPMIDYFQEATEGKSLLSGYSSLSAWWSLISENSNFITTRPNLSEIAG